MTTRTTTSGMPQTLKNVVGIADSSVTDSCLDLRHICVPHRSSHAVETSLLALFSLSPQMRIPGLFYDHHQRKYLFLRISKIQYNAVTNTLSTLNCGIYALGQLHNAKFGLLFGPVGKQKSPKLPKEFCANASI